MSLQSDSANIEYGYAKAYTKSGLIGVKLWICYSEYFTKQFKESFLQYVEYSKIKNAKTK
jgi:ribosomal protein S3